MGKCKDSFDMYTTDDAWEKVNPNVIYNRFDLMNSKGIKFVIVMREKEDTKFIPCLIEEQTAFLGTYLLKLDYAEAEAISEFIFNNWGSVKRVEYFRTLLLGDGCKIKRHNDFHIDLPEKTELLEKRLSKKGRYNIKRELRLMNEQIGEVQFLEYSVDAPEVPEAMQVYFKFKLMTHHYNYYMTAQEYIDKFHVSHIYVLQIEGKILSLILSCEQCDVVYIENLTYDLEFSKYSPGQVLYDWYLKRLIEKGKTGLFLSGGNLEYKRRYGGIEEQVSDFVLYRKNLSGYLLKSRDLFADNIKRIYMKIPAGNREIIKRILEKRKGGK